MKRVCVFSGSRSGTKPEYTAAAADLGRALAREGLTLVYGGGNVGLMGAIADAAIEEGGEVVGVIPTALLEKELAHDRLHELRVVDSMHDRKAHMAELADGFVGLPGGLGTLEELFEVWTWAQLGFHRKPCGLLNVEGYFDPLLRFLDTTVSERFVQQEHRSMLVVADTPGALIDGLREYVPPKVEKWVDRWDL